MYSVELLPDLVQIQVRENFVARLDIPIQVWHIVEVMRRDFNEHHMTQEPSITENQPGTMQMLKEKSEDVGMDYPEIPDSRLLAQRVDDFLFPWEEAGSTETPSQ